MIRTATGTFEVTLEPLAFEATDPAWRLARRGIDKRLSGDLQGSSRGQMLSAMGDTPGSAGYVAIEHVTATLHGRAGGFVLQHSGVMDRGQSTLQVQVVPDSGSGALLGLRGRFEIRIADGVHAYTFEYSLPGDGDAAVPA